MDKKALILIVDDNAEHRELLVWTLELYGFRTMSAARGREAVELAIEFPAGLVLMDLNMPGMNGYEATRAIHAHRHGRKIPVVAVSADCCGLRIGKLAFEGLTYKIASASGMTGFSFPDHPSQPASV